MSQDLLCATLINFYNGYKEARSIEDQKEREMINQEQDASSNESLATAPAEPEAVKPYTNQEAVKPNKI